MKPAKESVNNAEATGAFCPSPEENKENFSESALSTTSGDSLAADRETSFGRVRVQPSGCWEWIGANNQGYGVIGIKTGTRKIFYRVTRLVYRIFYGGKLRKDQEICHACDNPTCCNPAHLFAGTHSDNMQDRSKKKRYDRHHGKTVKLTLAKVAAIRAEYAAGGVSHAALAEKYCAHINSIGSVLRGETWIGKQGRPPQKPEGGSNG